MTPEKCHCGKIGKLRSNLAGQPVLCDYHYSQAFGVMPYGMPGNCHICGNPGKVYYMTGGREMLCEEHYLSSVVA